MTIEQPKAARRRRGMTAILAIAILVPSLWGFGNKFIEFVVLFRGDVDGVFAISPIVNYLFASLGFLCLFGWAMCEGMFHDIEGPKQAMLENEWRLDRLDRATAEAAPPNRAPEPPVSEDVLTTSTEG